MNRYIFLALILIPTVLFAKYSLFFHPNTVTKILNKRTQIHHNITKKQQGCLKCNGVLYQDDSKWIIWLNGQKFDSSHKRSFPKNVTIKKVHRNQIDLEWRHKGKTHQITLKPNQYYDATLEKTVLPYDYS